MKTAFSFWQGRIAPVFDVARNIRVLDVQQRRVVGRTETTLPDEPIALKTASLKGMGIETLICGAISRSLQAAVSAAGIVIIPFISGNLDEVIAAWFNGRIHEDSFAMPGCCGNRRGRRFRGSFDSRPGFGRSGRGYGFSSAAERGNCLCPACGYIETHKPGMPCVKIPCPVCGSLMVRKL
jgi:predicted Fe-Mo cluster-binding NifX family protein